MIPSEDVLTQSDNTSHIKPVIPPFATSLPLSSKDTDMRKKFLSLDLELKKKPKLISKFATETGNESSRCMMNQKRKDAYGIPITKYKPKQKVTFIDLLNPNKQLALEEFIESFKEHNIAMSYPDNSSDVMGRKALCCSSPCCIF